MGAFRIQLLATGGTLAKRYDAASGELVVDNDVVEALVSSLRLPDVDIRIRRVMALDSLDMTEADRAVIVDAVRTQTDDADAVVITHGTDTLSATAAQLIANLPRLRVPVVLTGAMVPYCCEQSDALQNVAQAVMGCRLLAPGVHVVFHGRALAGARALKDHDAGTFVAAPD